MRWLALVLVFPVPAQAETLRCTPALKFWCQNIHVSCAGRSKVASHPFTIEIDGATAKRLGPDGAMDMRVAVYEDARVLRAENGADWIRLQNDGVFVERRQTAAPPLMMRGRCAP